MAIPFRFARATVFSSSATVYGSAKSPVTEETPVGQGITNPYGQTKYFIEKFLEVRTSSSWRLSVVPYDRVLMPLNDL